MRSSLLEEGSGATPGPSAGEYETQATKLHHMLDSIAVNAPLSYLEAPERVEAYRDFLLKEMAWMATDFGVERKRHVSLRKKRSKAIMQHFKSATSLHQKQARAHEVWERCMVFMQPSIVCSIQVAIKKLAARVSRLIKSFWTKIDRFISFKHRLEWQATQRKAMDRHLVSLVRQSEQYTEDLSEHLKKNDPYSQNSLDDADGGGDVARPFLLDDNFKLRPYQRQGLNWLVSMHERRLNGILADEMGLGKTLQTIALLAHLAAYRGIWGPHLVVVPTSCLVNWESELKRFCPSFKVLTYYGSAKARKQLRVGWSKLSAVHVVVTSYQLSVQDSAIFRRKKFYYLILDEAHNIKNFNSRRWRTLLAFQAQRRLLLTGTPLQNSLMELWSLMHFLMPHLFRSRDEFSYWFASPLQYAIEGNSKISDELIKRLHSIMRPFVLRRLKGEVARQLPRKFEHELPCQLSRRQKLLYEEFLSCSRTRYALGGEGSSSNFVSLMSVVMQLRKVCNHPDLFEPRSVGAPLVLPRLSLSVPLIMTAMFSCPPGIFTLFGFLDSECNYPPMHSLLAPLTLVNAEDYSLGGAATLAFDVKSKRVSEGISACGFILRCCEGISPLVTAWGSIYHRNDSDCMNSLVFAEAQRIQANRQRLMTSDMLREHLENNATIQARCRNLFELIRRFVFVLPAALSSAPLVASNSCVICEPHLPESCSPMSATIAPIRHIALALLVTFPDRSLLQWDSGKFHQLAPLLRCLRRDGHRCLIFTQMSKMLDILEGFLCWHGHCYLRLDGGTPPANRQRLMDRFNSDISVFCFLLSTRSGGLGVNLTGADTVIFYDSDWNPAMDAQAMDRAHRIGQSRDVHIYRLVCSSTIEENILLRARQKQKLEFVTLTEGHFDNKQLCQQELTSAEELGYPNKDIAIAMANLEDDSDATGAAALSAEVVTDSREFDFVDDDAVHANIPGIQTQNIGDDGAAALDAGVTSWHEQTGPDINALTQSLSAVERQAIVTRERFSVCMQDGMENSAFLTLADRRLIEAMKSSNTQCGLAFDIDDIESRKRVEENRACFGGEIAVTDLYFTQRDGGTTDPKQDRSEFLKRRRLALLVKHKRMCTGAAWETRIDARTNLPFWYNVDTAEATWLKPSFIQRRDIYIHARHAGYGNWPKDIALHFMTMCEPKATRCICALVCRNWASACNEDHLLVRLRPLDRLELNNSAAPYCGTSGLPGLSLRCAMQAVLAGESLVLGAGCYQEDTDLPVNKTIRLIGDSKMPERVLLQLGGAVRWCARGGVLVGITLCRSGPCAPAAAAIIVQHGHLACHRISVDNAGAGGAAISVLNGVNRRT